MTSPDDSRTGAAGFTLIEMMVAMAVLVVGLTSLLGLLTAGVSMRRGTDARQRAVWLADGIFHRLEQDTFKTEDGTGFPSDQLQPLKPERVDDFPGMSWSVDFAVDEERPDLVLATVKVRWLEEGESVQQEFHRILMCEEPFAHRVARLRQSGNAR